MLDNVLEFDGGMVEYSQAGFNLPEGLLLDYANAFPSMAREWIFRVLNCMGCPQSIVNLVVPLYHD